MSDTLRGLDDAEATSRGGGLDRVWALWNRRKWLGIVVFLLPFTAATAVIMALPDLYQSTALVMIERQQVPEAFVRATVTSELEIRLHTISQEILSRSRLESLISRMGLYSDLRGKAEEAVDRMRRDIRLELRGADANRGNTTTSFALSYRGRDPQTVATVTNTLASFYIEENLKARERQATGTAEFLKVQLNDAKRRLDEQEARMGELQRRYLGELPQQLQGNLATLESLNTQLRINSDNQTRLAERRDQIAGQLAQAKLNSGGPEPDEVRLARLQQELATLRIKYTDLWPDIIRIKDEIERLQKDMAAPKPKPKPVAGPPTPEVARLQDALGSVETELRLAKQDQTRLKQGISNYQARLDNAPKREQEYLDATRDYQGTKELYQTLSRKYDDALLAESMEQRQKGEQFRILDSALPSGTPAAPRRSRLLIASLALSLVLGAGAMVLAELLDTSFHSSRDLRAYTTVPILVNIPRIVTGADLRRRRWRFRLAAVGVLVALVVVGGSSYFFAHGNEQLAQLLSRGDRAS
jgi:polysaccharide chain length determinant protein (PEP-CTERM system associated)